MSTLFAFLHHLAAFTLVSALAVEFVLIRQELTMAIARRLPIVDAVLGVSAGFLLVIGMLRVFFFEKSAAYYFHSHAFMTKLSTLSRSHSCPSYRRLNSSPGASRSRPESCRS